MTDLRAGYMKDGEPGLDPVAEALAPAMTDPWSWSDDGEALVWGGTSGVPMTSERDGETVVFREELVAMLAPLEREGLPDLSAVVLLAASAREGGPSGLPPVLANTLAAGVASGGLVARLVAGLERLAALPAALRQGARAKALLAEVVFEGRPRATPPPLASRVVRALEGGLPLAVREAAGRRVGGLLVALAQALEQDTALLEEGGAAEGGRDRAKDAGRDRHPRLEEGLAGLAALADGLQALDAEALRLRAETGLDRLPRPADPAAPGKGSHPGQAADERRGLVLLDALARVPELSGLARTARRILAATHLPRPLAEPLDLPTGGFADIASAGPLDRLLVSELAHDAETLAVRIVEREALYVRREAPRKAPDGDRALLLDCGIRLWGAARVFAAAVALALAAHAVKGVRISAFRARGDEAIPLSLTSAEGLTALLAALDPAPHPAAALASFRRLARLDARGPAQEAVLVTHEAALQDPALAEPLRALAAARPRLRLFAATVDATGRYRLSQIGPSGPRRIAEARIDLTELLETDEERRERLAAEAARRRGEVDPRFPAWARRRAAADKAAAAVLESEPDPRLPWALRRRPYPLLLPVAVDGLRAVMDGGFGLVAATPDGRLLHAPRPFRGGRALLDRMPPGRVLAAHADEGRALFLLEHRQRVVVVMADTTDGTGRVTTLDPASLADARTPLAAWFEPSGVVLVDRRTIALFDIETGRRIRRFEAPLSLGALEPLGRRFVLLGSAPRRVYVDAGAITLAPYPLMAYGAGPGERPLALLDRPGQDEPLLVTTRGIRTPAGERVPLVRAGRPQAGVEGHEMPFTELLGASALRSTLLLAQRDLRGDRWVLARVTLAASSARDGGPEGVPLIDGGVPVTGAIQRVTDPLFRLLEPGALTHGVYGPGVLTRVERIGAAEAGRLAVLGGGRARSRRWWIVDRLDEARLVLRPMAPKGVLRVAPVPFEPLREPLEGAPRGLRVARFPDGSEALLDPWGGLHLRSADRAVPEALLVLAIGDVAGVTAQGARMGPRWFHDEAAMGEVGSLERWREPVEGAGAAGVVEAVTAFASRLG